MEQPLCGIHAVRALASGPEGSPEQAGLERWVGARAAAGEGTLTMLLLLGLLLLDVVRSATRVELELAAIAHQVARLLVRGQCAQPVLLLAMHVRLVRPRKRVGRGVLV